MTTPDMWVKVKVTDQGVVATDRVGNPFLRCLDSNPKRAIKRLKNLLDTLAEEKEKTNV